MLRQVIMAKKKNLNWIRPNVFQKISTLHVSLGQNLKLLIFML